MSINLEKGQRVSLAKEDGGDLTTVVMGLGWDPIKKKGLFGFGSVSQDIDLDASALLFDENGRQVDQVWFGQLNSRCGALHHTGDNRTGDGDGDDEQIICDLTKVPSNVKSIVFTVNSYTGQNFSQIENATCRVFDKATEEELVRYDLSAQGNHTAQIMLKLYRHNGAWKAQAIGEIAEGRTIRDLGAAVRPHV